eukprot:g40320.t1
MSEPRPREPKNQGEWGECTQWAVTNVISEVITAKHNICIGKSDFRKFLSVSLRNRGATTHGIWPNEVIGKINEETDSGHTFKLQDPKPGLIGIKVQVHSKRHF